MRARPLVSGLSVLALSIGSIAAAASKDGRALPPAAPTVRSLPPGLWFVEGHYESHALEDEPETPRFAVVTAITTSGPAAEAAARRVHGSTVVDPGYPWVVTTRDVPIEATPPDRIVVIVGLYTDRTAADALSARVAHARVVAIFRTAHTPVWNDDGEERRLWVVQVDPRRDAEGVPRAAFEAVEHDFAQRSFASSAEYEAAHDAAIAALPRCTAERGSIYVTRESRRYYGSDRRWAPARCGSREAVVPVERTLREAIFEYRQNETRVHQVTAVSCDTPGIDVWRWTNEGREVIAGQEPAFSAGCAS